MIGSTVMFIIALFVFCTWGLRHLKHCVPLLFARRGRFWFDGGPDQIVNGEWDDKTRRVIDDLVNLDFEPLGIKFESFPFRTSSEIAFAASEKQTFASIHGFQRGVPHYYFYTPFEDGAVVVTSDFQHKGVRTDRFTHAGTSTQEMREVLVEHAKNVQKMARSARQPYAKYDQQARIRATQAYYDNPGSGIMTRGILLKTLQNAGISFVFLLVAGAVAVWKWLPFIVALKLFQRG